MEKFEAIKKKILHRLRTELPKNLYYHCLAHTEDVLQAAISISEKEKVTDNELFLIKIAALFHDTGFLKLHRGHEQHSCEVARETLPGFGLNHDEIEQVCDMIMATKLPQNPHNKLAEILCDADLDYLGRDDFFTIGDTLFAEMKDYGFLKDEKEWNRLQLKFLENHSFFTPTSINTRNAKKLEHLEKIKQIVASYDKEGN